MEADIFDPIKIQSFARDSTCDQHLIVLRFYFISPNDACVARGEAVIASHLPPVGSRLLSLAELNLGDYSSLF